MWENLNILATVPDPRVWISWVVVIFLMIGGMAGTVLPIIPGHLLILIGALLHKWINPADSLSWWGIALMAVLLVAAYVIDFLSGALGAKWFGGSKWAVWGVLAGGIIGLFFGLPGLILGPLVGGFLFEILFAKKELKSATKSTVGTAVGSTVGLVARLVIGVLMIGVFLADVFWMN